MRKVLFSLACLATIGLANASADVSYRLVADQSTFLGNPGDKVLVKFFLEETVTAAGTSTQSIIFKDSGLFGVSVVVTQTGAGDGRIYGSTAVSTGGGFDSQDFSINPNLAFSPNGFGGQGNLTLNDPFTDKQSGLILTAESINSGSKKLPPSPVANVGFRFVNPDGTPKDPGIGVNKILIGSLNFTVGSTDTTYQLTNYAFNQNTTQQGRGLDKSDASAAGWTGAATPIGGFFTFTVAVIPEPSSMALCGLVACGMSYFGYRRRKSTVSEIPAVA